MKGLEFYPAAAVDIDEIWEYSASKWGVAQADQYIDGIRDACHGLAAGEKSGRKIDDIRPGYLKYAVGQHFVFFRISKRGIEVVRILHQAMDVDRHLQIDHIKPRS